MILPQFNEGRRSRPGWRSYLAGGDGQFNGRHGGFQPGEFQGLKAWYSADYGVLADGAAHFTAAGGQYLSCPDAASLRPAAISISAMFYFDTTGVRTLICKPLNGPIYSAPYASYMIRSISTTQIAFALSLGGVFTEVTATVPAMSSGNWYHIVGTYDGSAIKVYFGGSQVASQSATGAIDYAAKPVLLGASYGASPAGDFHDGRLDSVAIFGTAVQASTVTILWNSGNGVTSAGITPAQKTAWGGISFWDMNEESGTRYDAWGSNDLIASTTVLVSPSVLNGGFETAGATPPAFGSWSQLILGTGALTRDTSVFDTGTASAKFVIDSSNNNVEVYQSGLLRAGDKYLATCRAKGAAGGESFILGEGNPSYNPASTAIVITSSWASYQVPFTAANSTGFGVRRAQPSNTFYIDGVTLTDLGPVGIAGIAAGVATDGNFAAQFNGTNQYLSAPNNATLQTSGDFTVVAAAYPETVAGTGIVFGKWASGQQEFILYRNGADWQLFASTTGSDIPSIKLTDAVVINSWALLIFKYTSATRTISLSLNNGTPVTAVLSAPIFHASTAAFTIGRNDGSSDYFAGRIDGVFFRDGPLTTDQEAELFNDGRWRKYAEFSDGIKSGMKAAYDLDKKLGITADSANYTRKAANFVAASSQYLSCASNSSLQVGSGSFSVAAWVKPTSTARQFILGKGDATGSADEYYLILESDGKFHVRIGNGTTGIETIASSYGVATANTWCFVVFSYDAVAQKQYISVNDGTVNNSTNTTGSYASGIPFCIGRNGSFNGLYANAAIGPVGWWQGYVLDSGEITALYNGGKELLASELEGVTTPTSYWDFSTNLTTDAFGGNTLTNNNTVTQVAGAGNNQLTNNNGVTYARGVDYYAGVVSKWLDRSGNGYHLTQATNSKRPAFMTDAQNGKPAILFDGVDDFLAGVAMSNYITASECTILVVYKVTAIGTDVTTAYTNDALLSGDNGVSSVGLYLRSTPVLYGVNFYSGSPPTLSRSITVGSTAIAMLRHGGGKLYMSVNNGTETSANSSDTEILSGTFRLGGNTTWGKYYTGSICEVIVYNKSQSVASLYAYLNAKYGVY